MQFEVFSLLPEVFPSYFETSILQRARERGLIEVQVHNIRDYTHDKHHTTDDTPYGGGGGMVMKPEPVFEAVESVLGTPPACPVILLTPQGRVFSQNVARELATRFHDAAAAEQAIAGWHAVVTGQGDTSALPLQDVAVPAEGIRIAALLTAAGITPSNSEANRKLKERAVKVEGAVVEDPATTFAPGFEGVLQVGKRNFARVRLVAG